MDVGDSREKSACVAAVDVSLPDVSFCLKSDSSMPTYCKPFCRKVISAPGGRFLSADRCHDTRCGIFCPTEEDPPNDAPPEKFMADPPTNSMLSCANVYAE